MRKLFPRLYILVILVIVFQAAPAQDLRIIPDLRFENFNAQRNFSYGYIGTVSVDRKGYVWSTGNGLFRFDGLHVQAYTNFNNQGHGLRANYSDDLLTDRFGRLWIGNGKGLCYYNDTLDNFHYIDFDSTHPVTHAFSFLLDGNSMWFVCNRGLCRLDLRQLTISTTSLTEFSDPIKTFRLGNGLLGISSRTGLYVYDPKKDDWIKKTFSWQGNPLRIRECILNDGVYWAGTNYGLWQLSANGEEMEVAKGTENLNISSLNFHPADGLRKYIWLGTTNNGLQLFDIAEKKLSHGYTHDDDNPYSLQTNNISSMHFDAKGRLWLGTEEGISLFDYRNQSWKTRELNLKEGIAANNVIRKIMPDKFRKDSVWMLCNNQGILLVDWKDKHILRRFNDFPRDNPPDFSDIVQLDDGKSILLGKNELMTWNPAQGTKLIAINFPVEDSIPVAMELTSMILTTADDIYITGNTGLYLYHPSSGKLEYILLRKGYDMYSSNDFLQGVYDNNKSIWLASRRGLVKYNTTLHETNVFYNDVSDPVSMNALNQVEITGTGQVLCSSGAGISIFNEQGKSFTTITGFGTYNKPACYGILVKGSTAWINSNAGLLRLNLVTHKTYAEVSQQSNVYSPYAFANVGNEVVIGYRNMYTYFDPGLLDKPVLPSNPIIEKILLNNKRLYIAVDSLQEYQFDHLQNSLSFYFTAFEYYNPAQIHFRYKLEGHDNDWTYPDEQRYATYIRLPPGHYIFKVQSGNSLGQWNETSAVFRLNVVPPFWQRWWFVPLLALSFIVVVILVAVRRIQVIRKQEEEKTELNKSLAGLETRLLRSQMNPHFIFNSLNSIQKYIWENKEEDAAEYLASFAKLMRSILENSRHENILLGEELAIIKLYIELEHRRSNGKFDYRVHADKNLELDRILVPPLLIQPYIENAIWHGLSKKTGRGQLDLSINIENDLLVFIIDDDGVGRDEIKKDPDMETGKKSLGMEITRQRISKLKTERAETSVRIIDKVKDGVPAGTTVIVSIPVKFKPNA